MGTSRAQDCAQRIKEIRAEVERANLAYRRGGSVDAVNRANRALAEAHNDLYETDAGLIPEH